MVSTSFFPYKEIFARLGLLIGVVSPLVLFGCSALSLTPTALPATAQIYTMDTVMELTAYGETAPQTVEAAGQLLIQLDHTLDRTSPTSVTYAINHSGQTPVSIDPTVHDLLAEALYWTQETHGKFDLTIAPLADLWGFTKDAYHVPTAEEIASVLPRVGSSKIDLTDHQVALSSGAELDFGGIAKGLAAEQVQQLFENHQIEHALANLGGDLMVMGDKPDGQPWTIGIQSPFASEDSHPYAGILMISDAYVLTSGSYERYFKENGITYHHIIDPVTGFPASTGLSSVTLVSDLQPGYGIMCDALATALFTMTPEEAMDFWREHASLFQMILIPDAGDIWITPGLEGCFKPSREAPFSCKIIPASARDMTFKHSKENNDYEACND